MGIINMILGAVFNKGAHGPVIAGAGTVIGPSRKALNFAGSKGTIVISAAGNDGFGPAWGGHFRSRRVP